MIICASESYLPSSRVRREMKKPQSRGGGGGIKISPWITLFIGYVLGYILYPMLQLWTCHCDRYAHQDVSPGAGGWVDGAGLAARAVSGEDFIPRYLHPSVSWLRPQALGRPKTLSGEYQVQKTLFVAVITAEKYLPTRARAVYDTWGRSVTKIVFFVGADCNTSHPAIQDLPIVKLPGIPDNVYPPQKKVFAVLHYVHDHYIGEFQWFMRADDDVYVRGDKLEELLGTMNFNEKIYLGLAGTGKAEDIHRLGLRPHERYCMGGPGVIFSGATLRELAPYLDHCLSAVDRHNEARPEHPWYNEDVELGRCVSRSLNIQCSTSAEGRTYFIQDYTSAALHPLSLWQSPVFRDLITLHPIKQPKNLYAVHHMYEVTRSRRVQRKLQAIEAGINAACERIPPEIAPPWQVMPACTVQLCSGAWAKVGVATYSTLFSMVTSLPRVYNPRSVYEMTPWEHFSTSTMHSVAGLSPEHGLYTSLQAEIAGVVGLIEHQLNTVGLPAVQLQPVEVVQGYTRFSEEVGREYILEVMFIAVDNRSHIVNKRVRLIRPLSQDITIVTESATPTSSVIVNVILPVFQADKNFLHFMEWYYRSIGTQKNVHLILCVVANTGTLYTAQATVANHTRTSPGSRVTVLSGRRDLSPSGALELGVSVLGGHDLVFIADTSLRIRPFFFRSCRVNTVEGAKVFFPVPYVMFDEPQRSPGPGRWAYYSHSSACMYKSDFVKFSDVPRRFFEHVSRSGLELFQAPEPGLMRVGRAESCEGFADLGRQEYCRDVLISSQFESETIDYLYHHDTANHKSLSFLDYEETL